MWSSKLIADTRGTSTVEYAFLLFAVFLVGAGALRKIGPRVMSDASITTRILNGEDIAMSSSGSAAPRGDSLASSDSVSSKPAAMGRATSASTSLGGESLAMMSSGAAYGGGVVLGASGSSSFGGSRADALLPSGATAGSNSATKAAAAGPTPHFTAALFQSSATTSNAKSASNLGSKAIASTSSKTKTETATTASKEKESTTTSKSGSYSISAKGEAQMTALLNEAKSQADGKPPLGHCYAAVADYIDAVGYGNMGKAPGSSLPSVPDAYGTYAHQFADYMNAKGANGQTNASRLGLQKLPITNPYDAPPGSIVVVRAGTPGTANPVAGDIVVVGKNGQFYNDGNMGYGGSQNFPKGNTYVLGVYAPK